MRACNLLYGGYMKLCKVREVRLYEANLARSLARSFARRGRLWFVELDIAELVYSGHRSTHRS